MVLLHLEGLLVPVGLLRLGGLLRHLLLSHLLDLGVLLHPVVPLGLGVLLHLEGLMVPVGLLHLEDLLRHLLHLHLLDLGVLLHPVVPLGPEGPSLPLRLLDLGVLSRLDNQLYLLRHRHSYLLLYRLPRYRSCPNS